MSITEYFQRLLDWKIQGYVSKLRWPIISCNSFLQSNDTMFIIVLVDLIFTAEIYLQKKGILRKVSVNVSARWEQQPWTTSCTCVVDMMEWPPSVPLSVMIRKRMCKFLVLPSRKKDFTFCLQLGIGNFTAHVRSTRGNNVFSCVYSAKGGGSYPLVLLLVLSKELSKILLGGRVTLPPPDRTHHE